MDNEEKLLLDSYQQLLELSRQQLEIAGQERHDEQLSELQKLEKKKQNYQTVITQVTADDQIYQLIASKHQSVLIRYIEQLQLFNEQLTAHITGWYGEDSEGMKQVADHRKTLQAYGGLYNSDIVSYYFDEKK